MTFREDIDDMDADVGDMLGEVPVSYQPSAGGVYDLVGMFDRDYVLNQPFESGLDNRGPSVMLRGTEVAKLPVDPRKDRPTVTIEGKTYQGKATVNDGPIGRGRRLMLSKVG